MSATFWNMRKRKAALAAKAKAAEVSTPPEGTETPAAPKKKKGGGKSGK